MKQFLLPLLLLISIQTSFSQFSWNAEATLKTMAGTEDELPFWMVHNQRGRVLEDSNFAGWITGKSQYTFKNNSFLEVGAGFLGREGSGDNFFVDELYAHYETKFWSFTAGRKQQEEIYNGLSASNRSILWSLNARPLPGLQLETTRPVFLVKNFGFEIAWEEYLMDDDRFVENAHLHHKSFHLVYSIADRDLQIKAGIQHFAQWGGNSPAFGEQPESLKDYLRIITGKQGAEGATGSDQKNALGNHLGGYELSAFNRFPTFEVKLFYQHLFEDGSGRRLGNTPDGRYGLFVRHKEQKQLINSLIYEFYTTHHQSHTTSGSYKNDNYLNNTGYRSGWTYNNRVIGTPFFTIDPNGLSGTNRYIIKNNKFTTHHLGIGGSFSSTLGHHPYRLLISYAQNDGRRDIRYNPKQDVFYALYDIKLLHKTVEVNLQFAAEYDNYKAPVYGVGLYLIYRTKPFKDISFLRGHSKP